MTSMAELLDRPGLPFCSGLGVRLPGHREAKLRGRRAFRRAALRVSCTRIHPGTIVCLRKGEAQLSHSLHALDRVPYTRLRAFSEPELKDSTYANGGSTGIPSKKFTPRPPASSPSVRFHPPALPLAAATLSTWAFPSTHHHNQIDLHRL